jgi:hypothetical protein
MGMNGIGRVVSQLVHERNAARFAANTNASERAREIHVAKMPETDTLELSEAATARLEAWKARMGMGEIGEKAPEPAVGLQVSMPVDPIEQDPYTGEILA